MPSNDKLLLLGDFNAHVGSNCTAFSITAGTQWHGKRELQQTLSADSVLRRKTDHYEYALWTTRDPQSYPDASPIQTLASDQPRHHKLPWHDNILITRTMRGTDCWTHHTMLHCKASFRVAEKQRKQPSRVKNKLNVNKLNSPQAQHALSDTLTKNMQQIAQDISNHDAAWAAFRDAVYSTAKAVLRHPQRKTKSGSMTTTRRFFTCWKE